MPVRVNTPTLDLCALRKPGVRRSAAQLSAPFPPACFPAAPAQLPQLITQETLRSLEVRPTLGGGRLKLGIAAAGTGPDQWWWPDQRGQRPPASP